MNKSCRNIAFIMPRLLKTILFVVSFSASVEATEEEFTVDTKTLKPLERIEFGFVLLPDDATNQMVHGLADDSYGAIKDLASLPLDPNWGGYCNTVVTLPHVSIGQYGLLAVEFPTLIEIVRDVARQTNPFNEPMAEVLFATSANIFFDLLKIDGDTNPKIVELYKALRHRYMTSVATKSLISQALYSRFKHRSNIEELALIDACYQNWGTPEGERIRPHFTLIYNYSPAALDVKKAIKEISIPDSLKTITFNRLGIVQIDEWGNPTRLLYAAKLAS